MSLSAAHEAGWVVKVYTDPCCGSEKPSFGIEKCLEPPTDGRIISKTTGKVKLNHEHRVKWEIMVFIKVAEANRCRRRGCNSCRESALALSKALHTMKTFKATTLINARESRCGVCWSASCIGQRGCPLSPWLRLLARRRRRSVQVISSFSHYMICGSRYNPKIRSIDHTRHVQPAGAFPSVHAVGHFAY